MAHPWVAQGASLSYRELAGDISCPLIQGSLKSVRILPLKSLRAGLATCIASPYSALHQRNHSGREETAAAAKYLGQTD